MSRKTHLPIFTRRRCLAGFEVPVQRACVMLGLVLLWRLRFRHLGVWMPYLLALNAVLMVDPLASLRPGLWLSFGAGGFCSTRGSAAVWFVRFP